MSLQNWFDFFLFLCIHKLAIFVFYTYDKLKKDLNNWFLWNLEYPDHFWPFSQKRFPRGLAHCALHGWESFWNGKVSTIKESICFATSVWVLRTMLDHSHVQLDFYCTWYILQHEKCSNESSTKALLVWKYVLVDSTSRIQTVLE